MAVKLNSTGGGSVTLDSPSTASNYTVTLPSAAGTLATTTGTGSVFTNPTINGFTGDTTAITIGTTQFVKDTSGNVGIGTGTPANKVHISGDGSASLLKVQATNTNGTASINLVPNGTGNGQIYTESGALLFSPANTERMRLDASGNLGLGVTPTDRMSILTTQGVNTFSNSLMTYGAGTAWPAGFANIYDANYVDQFLLLNSRMTGGTRASPTFTSQVAGIVLKVNGQTGGLAFLTIPAGSGQVGTQAMTLDASGRLLVTTTSAVANSHQINQITDNVYSCLFRTTTTTAGASYGIGVTYASQDPNGTGNEFIQCYGSSTQRFAVRSNGGVANFSGNNVNLSDERVKTEITPAPSWLPKINAIEVVNFKYKDQTHEDPNLGVIAQQVLSVAPELVDEDGFGETPEDGVPLMAIFETDLKYAMLKAIQELSAQNNALEARLAQLEAK